MPDLAATAPQLVVESSPEPRAQGHRERILRTALALLTSGGRDALTTRAVAEAAGVQPPVLYRLFQDKEGLLRAVAEFGFQLYFSTKRHPLDSEDPVEFLREGWRRHVDFGLTHPELYLLMYANPEPVAAGASAEQPHPGLQALMHRVARLGRLRLPEDRATLLFHAGACGTVMTLLGLSPSQRDLSLSELACDASLRALLVEAPPGAPSGLAAAATTLQALLAEQVPGNAPSPLSQAEQALLTEWLSRLANARQ